MSQANEKIKAESISLPKGGGAIRGMGETFSPNEFSGTASFSIPIPVSPCRSAEPALALQYNSGSGNGIFGLGNSLSTPAISCATNKGVPRYDGTDRFVIEGNNYLVPFDNGLRDETLIEAGISQQYRVQKFAPRQLGDFSLIEFWQPKVLSDSVQPFWKVTSPDHSISIFGKTEAARIYDPAKPNHIFSWLLEEVYDTKGNHQIYHYLKEIKLAIESFPIYEENRSLEAQRYPSKICYGNDKPISDSILSMKPEDQAKIQWHFEILFNYGEYSLPSDLNSKPYAATQARLYRPDPFSTYQAGFEIRTLYRCQGVMLFHRFPEQLGAEPVLVKAQSYRYGEIDANTIENGHISQLLGFTDIGFQYDLRIKKYTSQAYPETELAYSKFSPTGHQFENLMAQKGSLVGLNQSPYSLVDLYGHGIPGILYADGQTSTYREAEFESISPKPQSFSAASNLALDISKMFYGEWQNQSSFPVTKSVGADGLSLMDITGNGQLDLMLNQPATNSYWQAQPNGNWTGFRSFSKFPTFVNAPNQTWLNATGAGLSDLLQIRNDSVYVYPSARAEGFNPEVSHLLPKSMPSTLESSEKILLQFSDMAGTGAQHFVKIESGKVTYWPNLGYGRFGEAVQMGNAPKFDQEFNSQRLFLADIDGSGTTDLIYVGAKRIDLYLNFNGNSFSDPIAIDLAHTFDAIDQISFADVYGQGTTCLLLALPLGSPDDTVRSIKPQFLCYDFCQHQKPYLLNKINNNLGAETEIVYASSVDYYLADKKAGLPWITNIPFPVQVIAKTITREALSETQYTSQYAYHHGFYDGEEREFKGFGRVDRQDCEYFPSNISAQDQNYVAPVLSRTWYDVGCFEKQDALLAQYQKEYYQGDSAAFAQPQNIIVGSKDPKNTTSLPQAYATLAGSMIHQEIYGLDDSDAAKNPYTVACNSYQVSIRQASTQNNYGLFFVQPRESLTYTYDRNPSDPQIHQQFTLKVDEYGHVEKTASIAYPRRGTPPIGENPVENLALAQQFSLKMICEHQSYINHAEPNQYLLGVPIESQSYHIIDQTAPMGKAFSFDEVALIVDEALKTVTPQAAASSQAVLLSWQRQIYADNSGTKPLAFGVVTLPLLIYQQQTALDSKANLLALYKGVLDEEALNLKLKQQGFFVFDDQNQYWWNPGLIENYFGKDRFFLPSETIAPSFDGNSITTYRYDDYQLLIKETKDALGNKTTVQRTDYQVLLPIQLSDPNGVISEVRFNPLGQVIYTSVYGFENGKASGFKPIDQAPNKNPGSLAEIMSDPQSYLGGMQSYFYYDLFNFQNNKQPVFALSLTAENYPGMENRLQTQISYSDGLGRELQSKLKVEAGLAFIYTQGTDKLNQAETDHRWLTSGFKFMNNKELVVQEFEPYYIDVPDYTTHQTLNRFGVSSTLYYDPIGRLIKTLTPKGFLLLQDYSPWQTVSSDANDSILLSPFYRDNIIKPDKNAYFYDPDLTDSDKTNLQYIVKYFANTPETSQIDNLGHPIAIEKINQFPADLDKPLDSNTKIEKQILSDFNLVNILGNVIKTADPRLSQSGIYNFEMSYLMGLSEALFTQSQDAGKSWLLPNIFGNPIFSQDSRNIKINTFYDVLQRPNKIQVIKSETSETDPLQINQIVRQIIYGDTPDSGAPEKYNLRGQIYRDFDTAGSTLTNSYSLGAQPMAHTRRFFKDYKRQGNWDDISQAAEERLLETQSYAASIEYDALNRVISETDSDGNITQPKYLLAGWLDKVWVKAQDDGKDKAYVSGIQYDAKGQRLSITYGNQTLTTYRYDTKTYALQQIKTTDRENKPLLDILYQYDPMGNVIQKNTPSDATTFFNNQQVSPVCHYLYDSIYQLTQGSGREKVNTAYLSPEVQAVHASDLQQIQNYIERYRYDLGGNRISVSHSAQNNQWTRSMVVSNSSNRAVSELINGSIETKPNPDQVNGYFDLQGNQINLGKPFLLQWDFANQLQKATVLKHADGTEDAEYYQYDSGGQRVRKVNETYQGSNVTLKKTTYLGQLEIRQTLSGTSFDQASVIEDYHSLRIMDDTNGIATRNVWLIGSPPDGATNPMQIYHLQDNLGSYTVQLDDTGGIILQEEYSPFGCSTLLMEKGNTNSLIHYRYSGKERDSVTGFYYYGARYYASWLARWLSPDPAGTVDGLNLYAFVGNNPVTFIDVKGKMKRSITKNDKKNTLKNNKSKNNCNILKIKHEKSKKENEKLKKELATRKEKELHEAFIDQTTINVFTSVTGLLGNYLASTGNTASVALGLSAPLLTDLTAKTIKNIRVHNTGIKGVISDIFNKENILPKASYVLKSMSIGFNVIAGSELSKSENQTNTLSSLGLVSSIAAIFIDTYIWRKGKDNLRSEANETGQIHPLDSLDIQHI